MSEYSPSYIKSSQNIVKRMHNRGAYDYATVHSVVNGCSILHVSFNPPASSEDAFPVTLPMIGAMCSFSNPAADPNVEPLDIYVHGHAASRLMKLPESAAAGEGLPVCVSATLLDGIVLALTPFNHSCNYRSAVLFGYATLVHDERERMFAMHRITDALVPNRWDNTRVPPTRAEMQATAVLKIKVVSASAKIHVGGPAYDRHDLRDEELVSRVWTGVIPVFECLGNPIEGENNKVKKMPQYLDQWRSKTNHSADKTAYQMAMENRNPEARKTSWVQTTSSSFVVNMFELGAANLLVIPSAIGVSLLLMALTRRWS